MGFRRSCFCLMFYLLMTAADDRNSTKHTDRRGKALKISKKPCSDPSGKKGICTFKWDCINKNGTLMGTCVDGFIFGTCCQYDLDPLLYDDFENEHFNFENVNKITDSFTAVKPGKFSTKLPSSTTTTSTTTTTITTEAETAEATTNTPSVQLVTWTSIGPTRRPMPQRPIILSPFPFRPGLTRPTTQGVWPIGVAFPVDPFQLNRPLQMYRPPMLQSAQSSISNHVTPKPAGSYTIFTIPDGTSTQRTTTTQENLEMTTISVPIPEWSTTESALYAAESNSATTVTVDTSTVDNSGDSTVILGTSKPWVRPGSQAGHPFSLANGASTTTPLSAKKPQLDYRRDCGVRALAPKGRIVGGQSAYFGRWPWQVLVKEAAWLGLYQKNKCGGVLVSAKHVITAGHCQPGRFLSSLVVILGEYDLLTDYERMKPEMRRVKRMIVHRHYNAQNFDNDIAILELDPPVIFRPHISPICLPKAREDFTGKFAYVTGWGKTSHGGAIPNLLQEVQVPIISNAKCVDMFKEAGHTKLIKDTFLCAGYQAGGKDSCEGDSGGPLMVETDNGQWILVGTVSHGIRCADPNLPGVYMRISAYRSWIDKIIK